jgi:hypothetical protein
MGSLAEALEFGYMVAIDEALGLVVLYTQMAREDVDPAPMGVHLKMASRAMRSALELYGSRYGALKEEEVENG